VIGRAGSRRAERYNEASDIRRAASTVRQKNARSRDPGLGGSWTKGFDTLLAIGQLDPAFAGLTYI
jgi:hypothetical protein